MTPRLSSYFEKNGAAVNKALLSFLPKASESPRVIHESMRYSISAGGKRLRPILVMAAAEICGGSAKSVMPTACALEFIHTYSLVHDDLPAMDDDDLRRGKPTNHKVYGEDIAILAGDALLTHAFGLAAKNALIKGINARAVADVITWIAREAGTYGMVGGQVADIKADAGRWKRLKGTEYPSAKHLLEFIHLRKTSALIRVSLTAGARLAGGTPKQIRALDAYGKYLGLAFQITDDVLDVVGDKKKLGKRGSDRENQKLTFPAIFGLEASTEQARKATAAAHRALAPFGRKAAILHDLADFVLTRDH